MSEEGEWVTVLICQRCDKAMDVRVRKEYHPEKWSCPRCGSDQTWWTAIHWSGYESGLIFVVDEEEL